MYLDHADFATSHYEACAFHAEGISHANSELEQLVDHLVTLARPRTLWKLSLDFEGEVGWGEIDARGKTNSMSRRECDGMSGDRSPIQL